MRKKTVQACCDRGEAAVAREWPDWYSRITRRLNMFSFRTCLLGQLAGDYRVGMRRLHLNDAPRSQAGRDHGFDSKTPWSSLQLGREWNRRIKAHRAAH